ncbi:Uncharacterized protein MCB1EB_0715 [Mycoavidus cysteinexigens]|uniref:Uncharacterized protein n=1 Tax=Mycoavidus cysteinexigens TaxID=1553431 RepID=A0A2Z6ETY5_9BURK|nr:hypothetical protein [Mycoavidus cysteinexigens]BBE08876.1 Uncharacterized protein MCB1EB_0715 [Mycoavidus cysteinexigens]GAM52403.1 hypothetical protein EBME_0866 [bacterium endosymbiont of Mortierella elongata FMR23-6]GLR02189.1 hypothetical protein GCM10007934_20040 [Mycoavidus cysteinexigens]
MLDFNKFKSRLMEFLQSYGLKYSDLKASHKRTGYLRWRIDWRADYNKSFKRDFEKMKNAIELYNKALSKKDVLAAKAGLMDVSIRIGLLASSPFNAISHDLTRALNNKFFSWPSLGKGYTIPVEYFDKEKNEIDQKELVDLNIIQKILIDLVKYHGVKDEELERVDKRTGHLVWGINLNSDFNQIFNEKLLALQAAFDGYEKAAIQEDWRAVRAILQRIRLINFQLHKFLSAVRLALESAWSDKRFWPSFPENYKVPAHYNYKE